MTAPAEEALKAPHRTRLPKLQHAWCADCIRLSQPDLPCTALCGYTTAERQPADEKPNMRDMCVVCWDLLDAPKRCEHD